MTRIRVLILRSAGTNCDHETQFAWEKVGAETHRVHIRELVENPARLRDYQVLTIPGGFSYGDDISAGRILAAQLERYLCDDIAEFVARNGLVLGICNGFQVLVKAGLLPSPERRPHTRVCTIAHNDPPGFQDRWVWLRSEVAHCPFLEAGNTYHLPIAHGEGRVVFSERPPGTMQTARMHEALRYTPPPPSAPQTNTRFNPNGSSGDLAGLCDASGRILGLMPHPERFVDPLQHPCWTAQGSEIKPDGLRFFSNAVRFFD